MNRYLYGIILVAACGTAQAGNYATCLLDKLPGVRNQQATWAATRFCGAEHPGGWGSIEQGDGRGLFARYDSGDECTLELAKETTDRQASILIGSSCRLLYDEPNPFADPNYGKPHGEPFSFDEASAKSAAGSTAQPQPPAQPAHQPTLTAEDNHYRKIYAAHPDADAVFDGPAFKSWLSENSDRQRIIDSGTTDEIINLFSAYKARQTTQRTTPAPPAARPRNPYPDCVIRQTMTDADYAACGITPPGR